MSHKITIRRYVSKKKKIAFHGSDVNVQIAFKLRVPPTIMISKSEIYYIYEVCVL